MHFTLCQSPSSVFCHNQTPFQHFCSTVPSGCSQISTLTSILDTPTDGSTPVHIHFNFHHFAPHTSSEICSKIPTLTSEMCHPLTPPVSYLWPLGSTDLRLEHHRQVTILHLPTVFDPPWVGTSVCLGAVASKSLCCDHGLQWSREGSGEPFP